jgi:CubicO group peptidase (beta-lactamase class C family)
VATYDDPLQRVNSELADWADQRGFSGVALITRAGRIEFEGCYGMANRSDAVPVRPGTRFGLASLTKMFTAVAIADLVRQSALDFDTPVVNILPVDRRPATLRADVTVHHLLSHTSGIADYYEEEDAHDDEDFANLWMTRPSYRMLRPADFLPLFGDLPPYRAPGQRFQYSNAGYILLGLVIEELANAPYTEAVAQRVLRPAGMHSSGFFALDEARPDVAVGYLSPHQDGAPWRSNIFAIPSVGGADGGAFSNAADLDRFLTAYDDATLLGQQLRDAMLTPRCTVAENIAMGYGVYLYGQGRTHRFGHGGGDPGYEVLIQRLPQLDANTIVLANMNDICGDVRDVLVQAVISMTNTHAADEPN